MIEMSIRSVGDVELQRKFSALERLQQRRIDPIAAKFTERVERRLSSTAYPPERPNQQYIRTGIFGKSWSWSKLAPGRYQIENAAQQHGRYYPIYVVGNSEGDRRNAVKHNRQAWMHRGRWWVAFDIVESEVSAFPKEIADDVERDWNQ